MSGVGTAARARQDESGADDDAPKLPAPALRDVESDLRGILAEAPPEPDDEGTEDEA